MKAHSTHHSREKCKVCVKMLLQSQQMHKSAPVQQRTWFVLWLSAESVQPARIKDRRHCSSAAVHLLGHRKVLLLAAGCLVGINSCIHYLEVEGGQQSHHHGPWVAVGQLRRLWDVTQQLHGRQACGWTGRRASVQAQTQLTPRALLCTGLEIETQQGGQRCLIPANLAVRLKEHAAIHACLVRPVAPKVVVGMALQPECKRAGHHPGCKGQRGGAGSERKAVGRARKQAEGRQGKEVEHFEPAMRPPAAPAALPASSIAQGRPSFMDWSMQARSCPPAFHECCSPTFSYLQRQSRTGKHDQTPLPHHTVQHSTAQHNTARHTTPPQLDSLQRECPEWFSVCLPSTDLPSASFSRTSP